MPQQHHVQTDAGLLTMELMHADPLIVRVADFLSASEITTLLSEVGISQTRTRPAARTVSSLLWDRYQPFDSHTRCNTTSMLADMQWATLNASLPLVTTLQERIATLAQVKRTHVTRIEKILRYQPGQQFKLHSVRQQPAARRGMQLRLARQHEADPPQLLVLAVLLPRMIHSLALL